MSCIYKVSMYARLYLIWTAIFSQALVSEFQIYMPHCLQDIIRPLGLNTATLSSSFPKPSLRYPLLSKRSALPFRGSGPDLEAALCSAPCRHPALHRQSFGKSHRLHIEQRQAPRPAALRHAASCPGSRLRGYLHPPSLRPSLSTPGPAAPATQSNSSA